MKVSGCLANIICITQITCKFVNNALLTYKIRLNFFRLKILLQFFAHKNKLINSTVNMFIQNIATKPEKKTDDGNTIRVPTISIVLPFKDQIAANAVRRQLRDLSNKIAITLQPPLRKKCGRGASVNSLNNFPLHLTCGRIMRYQPGPIKLLFLS